MTVSHWRLRAREVIEHAVMVCTQAGMDWHSTLERIDAAYPFGPREHWPYRMWLLERRRAIALLGGGPTLPECRACGARAGKPCKDMATGEEREPHVTRIGEPACLLCGAVSGEGCRGGMGLCAPGVRDGQ